MLSGRTIAALCLCLVGPSGAAELPPLPADMHESALRSIDLVYREDFAGAFDEARRIIHKYGEHPAGYFFYAASLDAWMAYYQSKKKEDEFYRYCDLAVDKAEQLIDHDKADAWTYFFLGGAEGLKGNYETRYERWIAAFRYGWRGVSTLRKLQREHPEMHDVNYGIGTYDYWRSAMTRVMKWLPSVSDTREAGIAALQDARQKGTYTRIASAVALVAIEYNEQRYDTMLTVANEMLELYPRCTLFWSGRAQALYGLGRYDEAERAFRYILSRVENGPVDNYYNAVVTHYWLAKVYYRLGRYAQTTTECDRIRELPLTESIARRLESYLSEADELKRRATGASAGTRAADKKEDSARGVGAVR
jgi:tetratricopeptide (TPR) repeat protein